MPADVLRVCFKSWQCIKEIVFGGLRKQAEKNPKEKLTFRSLAQRLTNTLNAFHEAFLVLSHTMTHSFRNWMEKDTENCTLQVTFGCLGRNKVWCVCWVISGAQKKYRRVLIGLSFIPWKMLIKNSLLQLYPQGRAEAESQIVSMHCKAQFLF